MAKTRLSEKATYVARGYGQVEPNHLSAQKTGQIYAQLPAAADINILENGQFATYDYAKGVVDFEGQGEWMMVFNEIKLYRDFEQDCDFAMKKEDYVARVYSPIDGTKALTEWQARFYGEYAGVDSQGNPILNPERVTKPASPYEVDSTDDPFKVVEPYKTPKYMEDGTKMVPRLFKINVGDIWTTNTIIAEPGSLTVGTLLVPSKEEGEEGYLKPSKNESDDPRVPTMQVVKVYTMPDMQPGVKVMRIK